MCSEKETWYVRTWSLSASAPLPPTAHSRCAYAAGVDSCQSDRSGPLVRKDGNDWVLYGLASWNDNCGKPGVYHYVPSSINWINQILGKTNINFSVS